MRLYAKRKSRYDVLENAQNSVEKQKAENQNNL